MSKERARLSELERKVAELSRDNDKLKERMEKLREEHAKTIRALTAQAAHRPAPVSGPAVTSPRRHLRERDPTAQNARVGVFFDVANLSGAARRLYEGAVDYRLLLDLALGKRKLHTAHAYAIDKGEGNFESFARVLRAVGYRVSAKKPKIFPDGTMKADWDIGLAVDVMGVVGDVDVVVLGTGDGDFLPLVSAVKARGVRVELVSFEARTASELKSAVDLHVELDASVLTR